MKAALAGIERKRVQAEQIEGWAVRDRRGPLPGARARAALPDPLQARQERTRVPRRGRGGPAHAPRAARSAQARGRHRQPLPVPLAALPVRGVSARHRLPAAARSAAHQGRPAAGHGRAGVLGRRLGHHRDRRRALGARPRHRHGDAAASTSPRRASRSRPTRHWTSWRASACPPSTCRAGRSRCCRPRSWRPTRSPRAATARR